MTLPLDIAPEVAEILKGLMKESRSEFVIDVSRFR